MSADYDFVALNRDANDRDITNGNVMVTSGGVERFAKRWPCSGMRDLDAGIIFKYEPRGNLVDVEWFDAETGKTIDEPKGIDGAAVLALSQDAQEWLLHEGQYRAAEQLRKTGPVTSGY